MATFKGKKVTSERLASVYTIQPSGNTSIQTIVTDNSVFIEKCINQIRSNRKANLVVGLGFQPAGILQLCFSHECLIIPRLVHHPLPPLLKNFLEDNEEGYTFVGVNVNSLEERLFSYYGVQLRNTVDLGHVSSIRFENNLLCSADLKILAKNVLDKDINEPINIVNTSQVHHNDELIKHLVADSYVLHEICNRLALVSNQHQGIVLDYYSLMYSNLKFAFQTD